MLILVVISLQPPRNPWQPLQDMLYENLQPYISNFSSIFYHDLQIEFKQ